MNDPHVQTMTYQLRLREPQAEFASPPALNTSFGAFDVSIEHERVSVTMSEHFSTLDHARLVVDPVLQSWEASAALDGRRISFEYASGKVVDRDPPAGQDTEHVIIEAGVASATASGSGKDELLVGQYPPPPPRPFLATPDVRTLVARYESYREGHETLPAFSYFILGYVEHFVASGRAAAAQKLNVSRRVLDQLGRLSSHVGTLATARKLDVNSENRDFTVEEKAFMEAAATALIRRVGEASAQPSSSLPQLTLNDLPKII